MIMNCNQQKHRGEWGAYAVSDVTGKLGDSRVWFGLVRFNVPLDT